MFQSLKFHATQEIFLRENIELNSKVLTLNVSKIFLQQISKIRVGAEKFFPPNYFYLVFSILKFQD